MSKPHLVVTYAAGDALFADPCFWAFVNSSANVPDADFVVLTHDIKPEDRTSLESRHFWVVDTPAADVHFLYRDRHLAFYRFLNEVGHNYRRVLATDCRDVVFQGDPFAYAAPPRQPPGPFVILVAEGFEMRRSGFACIEQFEFQRDVPRPYLREDRERPVLNGGTFLGTPQAMQGWHMLVWATTLKTIGRCTDQAAVNWLYYHLERDRYFSVAHPRDCELCLTGEGVKEGAVEPLWEGGLLRLPHGQPYLMVHQWDRLDYVRESFLARYGRRPS